MRRKLGCLVHVFDEAGFRYSAAAAYSEISDRPRPQEFVCFIVADAEDIVNVVGSQDIPVIVKL